MHGEEITCSRLASDIVLGGALPAGVYMVRKTPTFHFRPNAPKNRGLPTDFVGSFARIFLYLMVSGY